jgi:surfactin synthase thioesterase subunit
VNVAAVEQPGRGSRLRERAVESIDQIARSVADAVEDGGAGETFLYGHSIGTLAAYETARLMEQRGVPLAGLVVSARGAPHVSRHPEESRSRRASTLSDTELKRLLESYAGTSEAILADVDLLRFYLTAFRRDLAMDESYVHRMGPPMRTAIRVFGGKADPLVSVDELSLWGDLTDGGCSVAVVEGGHFFPFDGSRAFLGALAAAMGVASVVSTARER